MIFQERTNFKFTLRPGAGMAQVNARADPPTLRLIEPVEVIPPAKPNDARAILQEGGDFMPAGSAESQRPPTSRHPD